MKTSFIRKISISACFVLGCFVGLGTLGIVNASGASENAYHVNANGQTYGSAFYAKSFETQPDLILAKGDDGTVGYVKADDLYGEIPKTPSEAVQSEKKGNRSIPLYKSDGITVIGQMTASNSTSSEQ